MAQQDTGNNPGAAAGGPGAASGPGAVTLTPTGDILLTPEQQKGLDVVRARVTYWLLAIFSFVLIVAVVSAVESIYKSDTSNNWTNVKEFMNIALPAISALLGSAIGFYFGSGAQSAPAKK